MEETDMSGGTDPWYCSWPRGLGVMLGGRFASLFLPGPASFELFRLRLLPVSTRYMVKDMGPRGENDFDRSGRFQMAGLRSTRPDAEELSPQSSFGGSRSSVAEGFSLGIGRASTSPTAVGHLLLLLIWFSLGISVPRNFGCS